MEKLLMLGTSLQSREIVEYAKSQGMYTIVTDYLPPEESRAKLVSDAYWMVNTGDLDTLEAKCREEGVTAVMCGVSEFNLEMTMALCKRLGLPSYCTPEAWHYSRDKADFKKLCREVGAPVAEDYFLSDALTDEELDRVSFPVVVKPVDLSCNRGISYCYDKQQLREAVRYARSLSKSPKIVVERMLHGKEWYTYYALADGEIRQICLNAMEAQPGQLKNLYSLTTDVTGNVERVMAEINPQIEAVLRRVGCREGIAWVQLMLDEDDHFYIIEMGYRLPGDVPDAAYPVLCSFDPIRWLTDYARGIRHSAEELPPAQEHTYPALNLVRGEMYFAQHYGAKYIVPITVIFFYIAIIYSSSDFFCLHWLFRIHLSKLKTDHSVQQFPFDILEAISSALDLGQGQIRTEENFL